MITKDLLRCLIVLFLRAFRLKLYFCIITKDIFSTVFTCMCVCTCVCMYIYKCLCVYVSMHMCAYVFVCVRSCICTHMLYVCLSMGSSILGHDQKYSSVSSSSSSCRAASTDIPDPLSPLPSITHRLRQVFRVTSCVLT